MSKNVGKIFEEQWKNSTPEYALLYRIPDAATSFSGQDNLRFSRRNPFDYLLWDSCRHRLYALELKTVAGKSISFERHKEDKGEIHYYQIDGLSTWNKYDGITCGFVIEFRALERTLFIDIEEFQKLIKLIDKKSFNINDLDTNEIRYIIVGQTKLKTRFKYHVDDFLKLNLGG